MNSHHTVAIGTWEGDKQQSIEYNSSIAVGIDCPRAKLRVSILLVFQKFIARGGSGCFIGNPGWNCGSGTGRIS